MSVFKKSDERNIQAQTCFTLKHHSSFVLWFIIRTSLEKMFPQRQYFPSQHVLLSQESRIDDTFHSQHLWVLGLSCRPNNSFSSFPISYCEIYPVLLFPGLPICLLSSVDQRRGWRCHKPEMGEVELTRILQILEQDHLSKARIGQESFCVTGGCCQGISSRFNTTFPFA